ncbi:pleckstrin homology domain-containing family S member 1 [Pelobates fuscus]|uniref:pleckstrin homology domain-containing family S member 1 n=1 Tax=Pelobates fuscus TaxID=191477 RepID=UPI002FE48CC6
MSLKMTSRRRSSSTDGEVLKRGLLTKSPGWKVFRNRSSWKSRIFKLCKTPDNKYLLNYFAPNGLADELKGTIDISEVKAVQRGVNATDKISVVLRMFNITAENVIYIKVADRDFYLIDENEKEIEEWFNCISQVWVEINRSTNVDGPAIGHPVPISVPEMEKRPKSHPCNHPHSGHVMTNTLYIQRCNTDSGVTYPPSMNAFTGTSTLSVKQTVSKKDNPQPDYDSDHGIDQDSEYDKLPLRTPPSGKVSPRETYLESGPDSDIGSDSESAYDYPRPQSTLLPEFISNVQRSSIANSDQTSDSDSDEDNIYQEMKLFSETQDSNAPDKSEIINKPASCEKRNIFKGSRLKKVHLLTMSFEETDTETISLSVPTEHMLKYLAVEIIANRLRVSKWKGPKEIGCLFRYGDDIDTMNDIRMESCELFSQMLNNSKGREVKLTVVRFKKASVFHAEGCDCNKS